MTNIKVKLERLETMCSFTKLSKENWDELDMFSCDDDSEIRMRAAETLGFHHNDESEKRLLLMLKDSDDLVRTEVCDSLSFSVKKDTVNALINVYINDISEMVRGYAVLAIGDIYHNISRRIEEELKVDLLDHLDWDSDWLVSAVYRTLILNGYKDYISCLMEKLESENYVDRIFVVSCFADLIFCMGSKEIELLREKCKELSMKEKTESVLQSLRNLMENI